MSCWLPRMIIEYYHQLIIPKNLALKILGTVVIHKSFDVWLELTQHGLAKPMGNNYGEELDLLGYRRNMLLCFTQKDWLCLHIRL